MSSTRPIDRFIKYLEFKGISPAAAEKELNFSNGYIQSARKQKGQMGSDKLADIWNGYLDLNLIWLITGEGEMLIDWEKSNNTPVSTEPEARPKQTDLASTPKAKNNKNPESAMQIAPATAPATVILHPQIITVDAATGNENIVFVGEKAAAGYLNGYGDREYIEKLPSFNLPGLRDGTFRAFEVKGNSMSPTLEDGEMVVGRWVEKLDYIREDRVHIVVTKTDGIVVKRLLNRVSQYGYVIAKSDAVDNRHEYPNLNIYPEDILELWYATWHGSFNFKAPAEIYKRVNNIEADINEVLRVLKENNLLP